MAAVAFAAVAAGQSPPPEEPLRTQRDECWKLAIGEPARALAFAAEELARASHAATGPLAVARADLVLCRGYAHEQAGQVAQAEADYRHAVEAGERLGDRKLLALALALRGELAYYRGAFDAALADLDRAYRLEQARGDEKRQRYVLNAIANVYADSRVGAYDRAIDYYRQLLAAHQAAGDLRQQATGHFNLGSTYERKGDLAAALAEFERAASLDRRRQDPDEVAFDERAAASVLVKLGRAREALPRLDAVVAHYAGTGNDSMVAHARLTRGTARRASGDPAGALADLDAAGAFYRRDGNDRFLERVEQERAEALAARGDFAAALRARTAQLELERRLAAVTRDEHTSRLRVQFDSDRKEAENRALARENALRGRALRDAERIRALQWTVIALAAVLLLVLAALALQQIRRARRLRVLAMTDELTRLPNRRAFFRLAGENAAAAARSGRPLAVLALDIDHFKRINDTQGHEAGDRVLQRVANAARSAVRDGDSVGRVGGEEFLALLPHADLGAATQVAERLRAAVASLDATDLAPGLRVTVSVGVALRRAEETIAALVQRADAALYRAKENGRNRVELASETAEPGP